jgi:carboxyl-terminal processing protease
MGFQLSHQRLNQFMIKQRNQRILVLVVSLLLFPVLVGAAQEDPYKELNISWDRLGAVYGRILENYYSQLDHGEIMAAAINGMLGELDSYSQFFDEEGIRQLRQDTTGKFAGLGITVGMQDQYPLVISPIEDTPAFRAGILPGDLIVGIEGRDTRGLSLDEVVNTLRGEPGTEVQIRIRRQGEEEAWDVILERQIIKIKSVALAAELTAGVGYISMRQTRFSEDTGKDIEEALNKMREEGVEGLILDLRGNPGGLLSQATYVADLLLPQGAAIVSIKEKEGRREETRVSQRKPAAGKMPIVVLIDQGSASASEIVAGAVQDNDRGVVLGTGSFGKGSVQTIFDLLDVEDTALKLTTALYYTPSGRSIHREEKNFNSSFVDIPFDGFRLPALPLLEILLKARDQDQALDQLEARFDLSHAEARRVLSTETGDLVGRVEEETKTKEGAAPKSYYTEGGRQVYGGGGISPDITVEQQEIPSFVQDLERRRAFFDFAVEYVGNDSALFHANEVPTIDQTVLDAFAGFMVDHKDLEERINQDARSKVSHLRQQAQQQGWAEKTVLAIEALEQQLKEESSIEKVVQGARSHIETALRRELVLRLKGKQASLLSALEEDIQVKEAIDLLKDNARYKKILQKGTS